MSSDKQGGHAFSAMDQETLLQVARAGIAHGIDHGTPPVLAAADYPERLREPRASFVTLELDDELRGCIGSLEVHRPLVLDVVHNAYAAAFHDPRFMPVSAAEHARLDIRISVLSPAEEMHFASQRDLINQLRPGIDGLILEERHHRGTFLPSVWEQLPDPEHFLGHLKLKAGLPGHYWSPSLRIWRYTTTSFPRQHPDD